MNNKIILSFILSAILFQSCSNFNNTRKEYAGKYTVKLELEKDVIPKEAIKDSIKAGLTEAKEAIKNAKKQMNDDLKLDEVDTSTTEGKIEYAAKTLGKGIGEFGLAMGEFGRSMGELAANVAAGSLDLAENAINKINFKVELKEDGKITSDKTGVNNFKLDESTWEVDGKTFYLVDNDKNKEAFEIVSKKEDGFVLKKDKLKFIFSKDLK